MSGRDDAMTPETWSYVVLLAERDDPEPWALRCLADRYRADGAIVLVACGPISEVDGTPEERRPALRELVRATSCWVVAPRDGATLADATELVEALHSMDAPVGFDPSVLPLHREPRDGATGIAELYRMTIGQVPRIDGGEAALWVHLWLQRERRLDTYNGIWERYARELASGLPWWVSVSMLGEDGGAERASVVVFR